LPGNPGAECNRTEGPSTMWVWVDLRRRARPMDMAPHSDAMRLKAGGTAGPGATNPGLGQPRHAGPARAAYRGLLVSNSSKRGRSGDTRQANHSCAASEGRSMALLPSSILSYSPAGVPERQGLRPKTGSRPGRLMKDGPQARGPCVPPTRHAQGGAASRLLRDPVCGQTFFSDQILATDTNCLLAAPKSHDSIMSDVFFRARWGPRPPVPVFSP